jgi:hypothetical protein
MEVPNRIELRKIYGLESGIKVLIVALKDAIRKA